MTNPFLKKAQERKDNPFLARKRGKSKTTKAKERTPAEELAVNGVVGIRLPELQGLKLVKRQREWKLSDKDDFTVEGVKVCHVREWDGFWTIDVVNGNDTLRFDNRFGSWLLDLGDRWTEPKDWVKVALCDRWYKELKRQGRHAPHAGISYFPTAQEVPKITKKGKE